MTSPRFYIKGKCSWFGGEFDYGMTPTEGLALIEPADIKALAFRDLFIAGADPAKGIGRQLSATAYYIACRWDYSVLSKDELRKSVAMVLNPANGLWLLARPADWGPNADTKRVADCAPVILDDLGLTTDDEIEITIV